MKKLGKLRLNQLSKSDLESRQMNVLKGGRSCGCVCVGCFCSGEYESERDDNDKGNTDADNHMIVTEVGEECFSDWSMNNYSQ